MRSRRASYTNVLPAEIGHSLVEYEKLAADGLRLLNPRSKFIATWSRELYGLAYCHGRGDESAAGSLRGVETVRDPPLDIQTNQLACLN